MRHRRSTRSRTSRSTSTRTFAARPRRFFSSLDAATRAPSPLDHGHPEHLHCSPTRCSARSSASSPSTIIEPLADRRRVGPQHCDAHRTSAASSARASRFPRPFFFFFGATRSMSAGPTRPPPVPSFADWEASRRDALQLHKGSPKQLLEYFSNAVPPADINSLILLLGGEVPSSPPALVATDAGDQHAAATKVASASAPDDSASSGQLLDSGAAVLSTSSRIAGPLEKVSDAELLAEWRRRRSMKNKNGFGSRKISISLAPRSSSRVWATRVGSRSGEAPRALADQVDTGLLPIQSPPRLLWRGLALPRPLGAAWRP